MSKKSYVMHVAMLLGSSAALLVFIFILVAHHRDVPEKVRMDRSVLLAGGSSAAERIKPVGEIAFAAAQTGKPPAQNAVAAGRPPRRAAGLPASASPARCRHRGRAGEW